MAQAFSIAAAVATAGQTGSLIALHLLPTGYNPVRDAVSDYGIGRYRGWFSAQAVAGGVAGLALAIALAETTPSVPTLVVVMLLVSAVARFLIPAFPSDQHGSRFQTVPGTIHMILAIVIFAALIIAASELGSTLEHQAAWSSVKGWITTLPWVMTGSAIALVVGPQGPAAETDLRADRAAVLHLLDRLVVDHLDRTRAHRRLGSSPRSCQAPPRSSATRLLEPGRRTTMSDVTNGPRGAGDGPVI